MAARSDQPAQLPAFDSALLAQLACPACYGDLRLEGSSLLCIACRRTYAIVDGIPVLIPTSDRPDRDQIIDRTEPRGGES